MSQRNDGRSSRNDAVAYDHRAIERKWQERWQTSRLYEVNIGDARRPYYNLMMFPYPSAEGLHVGNVYAYTGSDIHGRYMAMCGYDVFEPMGFDAFGIHSENYAIKVGMHPKALTTRNVERFREQLKILGCRFAWSHEVQTTDPGYYKWTQWVFTELFKAGLAERKRAPVNWCPSCKTVLADEQVIGGRCERCDSEVLQRELEQWFFKITNYAQKLLDNLQWIDWSEIVKTAQRNWIGASKGVEFRLAVDQHPDVEISVYTTRPDTIFGMTFVVLAPEHPLVAGLVGADHQRAVNEYCSVARSTPEGERIAAGKDKTGVFTGAYAINPVNGERVPIWIADYVLLTYGTGAIQGVPAHDERDFEFAIKFGIDIREVVCPGAVALHIPQQDIHPPLTEAYVEDGTIINSGPWTGMSSDTFRQAIGGWLEDHGYGRQTVKYHLRDWLISRQRYWGPPIPILYCDKCGIVPVPAEDLPVILPEVEDYVPAGTGSSPLANVDTFVHVPCPTCGGEARRETDVSDNFLDSAWYFLRYPSYDITESAWDSQLTGKWLPVDMYIGGPEHSVLHLLYTRFICMALHDLGYLTFDEPFQKFRAHGIITKDGAKMSKSKGNVVNPDEYIERYGSDTLRLYLMFIGPYDQGGDFSDQGIIGISRFLARISALARRSIVGNGSASPLPEAQRALHRTIKRVSGDLQNLKYNTVISTLMEYVNFASKQRIVYRSEIETLLLLVAPLAPHFAEEVWERIGREFSVHTQSWPPFDPTLAQAEKLAIPVQVNGRTRDVIQVEIDDREDRIKELALSSDKVRQHVADKDIKKVIYVPGKILNIVVS